MPTASAPEWPDTYLRAQAQQDVPKAQPAEAGVAAEQFVSRVATRSGGEWIYLRSGLDETAGAGATPVPWLPPDSMCSSYVTPLKVWSRDEHGQTGLLPLAPPLPLPLRATLAATGEPLCATGPAALTGCP
ncbi:hypothetical protein ACFW1M_42830 [Streptomyces inhibens]|uniref:hypothetical protein n=1 Tax=Streptomyces inhibens TaxID=2293571 RepID=UPI0036CB060C